MPEQSVDTKFLKSIPIFGSLSEEELTQILKAPENGIEEYGMKQVIIREAEIGKCMYVVLDGAVDVSIRGGDAYGRELSIATLRPGDFFGEQALTQETTSTGRRNATVRALQHAKVFKIDKKYVTLALQGDGSEDPTVRHTRSEYLEVRELIRGMRLFQSLTDEELNSIGNWTEVIKVGPGDFVLKESDSGDCMYVILDGTVEIFTLDDDGRIVILATHTKGQYFGEQSLLPGSSGKRTAYARSNDVARLIKVPKEYFRLVLNRDSAVAQALLKIGQKQKKELNQIHKH